jgi:hypothetical protein
MDLQYISDDQGRLTAVVIPIEDWNNITAKHEDLKSLEKPQKQSIAQKPSDFRGVISKKTTEQLLQHVEQARTQWERDIF